MDILSHGLWGGVAFGRKKREEYWAAFAFGAMPDLVSFGPFFVGMVLGIFNRLDFSVAQRHLIEVPQFVYSFYSLTHSLVIFFGVALIYRIIKGRYYSPMFAWLLHILVDIPTHSDKFFPTPFLWPISNFHINGLSWSSPDIFIPNILLLAVAYWLFFLFKLKPRRSK